MSRSALVVDDSKSARFALRKYLEGHAYKVDTAESAQEALDFLRRNQPEVIFLDHVMPGTDGFEALRAIKADPRTEAIPVVICSSNEGPGFNDEARERGASGVLQKPPSPEQLSRILTGLQQVAQSLRLPEPSASPPPSKVSNIREPDIAIEQAVMKALRSALPDTLPLPLPPGALGAFPTELEGREAMPPSEPDRPPPVIVVPPAATPAAAVEPVAVAPDPVPMPVFPAAELIEEVDQRLRQITEGLFVELAQLRAGLVHLEGAQRSTLGRAGGADPSLAGLQADWRRDHEALGRRLDAVEGRLLAEIEGLRGQLEAGLAAQSERISQVTQAARAAAADEAHAVAERTVMSAASRISDQLADSILKALGRS